jgi:Holliday junction DNA helicase RuvB
VGEDADTLQDMVEPYLIKEGFVQRTPRGRIATEKAYDHFGIARSSSRNYSSLFDSL